MKTKNPTRWKTKIVHFLVNIGTSGKYTERTLTIMLLGMKIGILLSSILYGAASLQIFIPGLSQFSYPVTIPIHMVVTYFLVFSVTIVIETTRKAKDRLIENKNHRLQACETVDQPWGGEWRYNTLFCCRGHRAGHED
jgi:hypothetical protein